MRVAFGNVDFSSYSGPNSFGKRLANALVGKGVEVVSPVDSYDILLAFIEWTYYVRPRAKLIQRLDGIWFNSGMNWKSANMPIAGTYKNADGVIFQSQFNKKLTEKYFGKCDTISCVIHNGAEKLGCNDTASNANKLRGIVSEVDGRIFICASNWRPHKRLRDIIGFFQKVANENDRLVVVGKPNNHDEITSDNRVIWLGDVPQDVYLSFCNVSDYMIHLAWLDHCPNVVCEALMAGCPVICTDSGGTKEIVGDSGIVMPDKEWDFEPHNLYDPPAVDLDDYARTFGEKCNIGSFDRTNDLGIGNVADKYIEFFNKVMGA